KWYADIAPAVAVYCRHDSADTGGSFHTLLFHREGCDTGRESELRMSEDEGAGTFKAPRPYGQDRSELAGPIEAPKRPGQREQQQRARGKGEPEPAPG